MDLNPDVTAIATLALAILTGWLAWETRKMSRAASDALELQSQPFLGLKRLDFPSTDAVNVVNGTIVQVSRLRLVLNNPGRVRINYEVESLDYSFRGTPAEPAEYATSGGVIHPGDEVDFTCSPVLFLRAMVAAGMPGEINFRINFWSSLERVYHFEARAQFVVETISPDVVLHWLYLEGPRYS